MKNSRTGSLGISFPCRDDGANARGRAYGFDTWLAHRFLRAIGDPPLRVVLWDGSEIAHSPAPPVAMVFRDRGALWREWRAALSDLTRPDASRAIAAHLFSRTPAAATTAA